MKLFKNKPDYVRLDDDVSFQIVRTNPKLTTNTKLMYDGENLYMESYDAAPLLSTLKYKHHNVWKTGLFNRDIRNFLLGTNTAAYAIGQSAADTIVLNDFDDQFENMYWCGVESINSDFYPQEMGCIAPLYIRKKLPNYFVIFRINTPGNMNENQGDDKFNFNEDVRDRAKIVKAFDLREGTPIGDYIKKYVEQREFKYDQSVYVNFSSNEIYYYGIDKSKGVLTTKVENFEEQLLRNDNTILKVDDWITSGFERNNLIFPYIINFEFIFDDKEISDYKFARYFGVYCNDIDLYDLDVYNYDEKTGILMSNWGEDESYPLSENNFYYIKDKNNNIFSAKGTAASGFYKMSGKINIDDFKGFENTSVSTFATRLPGAGKAIMILRVNQKVDNSSEVIMFSTISEDILGRFISTTQYSSSEYYENKFSCRGSIVDTASALAGAIRTCNTDEFKYVTAYNIDNYVVIESLYPGTNMNKLFDITFDDFTKGSKCIEKVTENFDGGTDYNGTRFLVYTSDSNMFFDRSGQDRDEIRYIKTGYGRDSAEIKAVVPYINDENKIDSEYSILITDNNGQYVNVSKTDQIEIIDKYYSKLGMLSFFPIRDFDFDTVSSAYGNYTMMKNELDEINDTIVNTYDYDSSESEDDKPMGLLNTIQYGRFYDSNGNEINTEYDYYFENILPELTTLNKSVPFVNKWGYIDESKDSCENPYRFNVSKIFETCNFSANTFVQSGDIMEYTHSMPYYVSNRPEYDPITGFRINDKNEYQYIPINGQVWSDNYEDILNYFSKKKSDGGEDPFLAVFGDTSNTIFSSKRFNKKYSRFLLGNNVSKSSTLFRGVKFEITELNNGKEVNTGKYNDYRFAFVYVPVFEKTSNTVYFIKNDDYKFIVGVVFFDMKTRNEDQEFNKAYVYAGAMGYFKEYDESSESE